MNEHLSVHTILRHCGLSEEDISRAFDHMSEDNSFQKPVSNSVQEDEGNKTLYPRAHAPIPNLNVIEDIARGNLLNPLYASVLEEFDNAKAAMSRAAHKLAAAVKLTDNDELTERTNPKRYSDDSASDILSRIRAKSVRK